MISDDMLKSDSKHIKQLNSDQYDAATGKQDILTAIKEFANQNDEDANQSFKNLSSRLNQIIELPAYPDFIKKSTDRSSLNFAKDAASKVENLNVVLNKTTNGTDSLTLEQDGHNTTIPIKLNF